MGVWRTFSYLGAFIGGVGILFIVIGYDGTWWGMYKEWVGICGILGSILLGIGLFLDKKGVLG